MGRWLHVAKEFDGVSKLFDRIGSQIPLYNKVSAIRMLLKRSCNIWEFCQTVSEGHLRPAPTSPIRNAIFCMNQHDMLGHLGKAVQLESVDEKIPWIQGDSNRALGKRVDHLPQSRERLPASFAGEEGSHPLGINAQVRKDTLQNLPRRMLRVGIDCSDVVDHNVCPQLVSHFHGPLGPFDSAIQFVGNLVPPPCRIPNRCNS